MPDCAICRTPLETQGSRTFCPACLLREVMGGDDGDETLLMSQAPARAALAELPVVPRFTLSERLGEGGFAVVYRAMQNEPVKREVAVKVLKPQVATAHVLARFGIERQTLARMEHPGIARLWDSGVTTDGQPFFAMELVRGEPVTEYCAKRQLPLRDRLDIFCGICDAVQHAHEKGVLHRDLKPSNILVAEDAHGRQVKIIDFGIAKALEVTPGTDDTGSMTALHQTVGTPGYMSPEQAVWGARSVDVRSDLYALGVVLYELLTGRTPLQVERLTDERARYRPVAKHITSVSKLAPDMLPTKLVRRDLDAITGKALADEPALRYASAAALAEDVRHHLNNEPVKASEPSWTYVTEKFTRRHLPFVVSGSLTLLAILGGLAVSTILYFKEQRARANAEAAQSTAERRREELITTLSRADFATAQRFKQDGYYQSAVACLVRALKQDPGFAAAAADLKMLLSQENSPQPSETAIPIDPAMGTISGGAVAASGRAVALLLGTGEQQRLMICRFDEGEWKCRELAIQAPVEEMTMAPSGDFFIYADAKHTVYCLPTGEQEHAWTWQAPQKVTAMAVVVKSGTAAIGCTDGSLWVLREGVQRPAVKLGAMDGSVAQLHISQDDPVVVAGDSTGEVRRFMARNPGGDERLMKLPAAVKVITVSNSAVTVAAGDSTGNVACVGEANAPLLPVTRLHKGGVTALALIGLPPTLVSAGGNGDLRVRWTDFSTGADLEPPLESAGVVRSIWPVKSSDEALIITADSAVRSWRRGSDAGAVMLRKPQNARYVAISRAGSCLAVQRDQGRAVETLMLSDRFMLNMQLQYGPRNLTGARVTTSLAFASDRRSVVAADSGGRAALWDTGSADFRGDVRWQGTVLALGESSAGGAMLAAMQDGSLLDFFTDGRPPAVRVPAPGGDSWDEACVSPDGRAVVWARHAGKGSLVGRIRLWQAGEDAVEEKEIDRLSAVAVHGGVKRIAAGLGNGYVRLLRPGSGHEEAAVPLHQARVTSVRFSSDGRALITGSTDSTIALWAVDDFSPMTDFFHLDGQVLGVAFSGNGKRFAAVTEGAMVAGDVESRALIGRPFRLRRLGGSLALNEDGTRLAAGLEMGEVLVQDIAPSASTPVPGWFLNLADGFVSRHMTPTGTVERTSHPGREALKQMIPTSGTEDEWTTLAKWLFAHPGLRKLTPWSGLTLDQYIESVARRPGNGKSAEINRLRPYHYREPDEVRKQRQQ